MRDHPAASEQFMNKDQMLKIIGFVFYSLICYEIGHCPAISTAVPKFTFQTLLTIDIASGIQLIQRSLKLPCHTNCQHCTCWGCRCAVKQAKRKASRPSKHCSGEFESSHAFECHRRHRNAQGTLCSDESSKTEITFTLRAGMATGILRQHSLERIGESDIK